MSKFSKIIKWLKSPTGKYGIGQSRGDSSKITDEELYEEILASKWGCDPKDYPENKPSTSGDNYHAEGSTNDVDIAQVARQRIAEADKAKEQSDVAKAEAIAAKEAAEQARQDAEAAKAEAVAAKEAADQAKEDAETAKAEADKVRQEAEAFMKDAESSEEKVAPNKGAKSGK